MRGALSVYRGLCWGRWYGTPRCSFPRLDGAILSQEWKEATWDRSVTGAPRSSHGAPPVREPWRGFAVKAANQRSQASLPALSEEPGINPKTVAKRRKRATVEDLKDGPERSALDGSDRGRRSGDRRIPASYAAAAGRLPPCPAAVHPAPDALGAAPVPAAMSH